MADFPIYRLVKGNTLTFTEMDDNLRWLSTNMSGSTVTITGSAINMSGSVNIIGNVQIAGTASIGFIKSEGYSTGSNQLGDDTSDRQTLIGIVSVSGSMRVSGSTVINNLTGSLFGTSSWATTASFATNSTSASFASTASYVSSNFQYEIHVSQVDGNDTTGNGDLLNPVASITKALTLTTTSRKTIIVHPGTYSENITIGATNTTITTSELTGANTLLSGTLTIGTSGSGSRISGLKMTNLVISGTAQAYISNCTVDNQVTKSSSGYVEIINSEMQCTLGIQISGAGITIINGNKNVAVAVSNASAQVIIKGCNSVVIPSASAGNLAIVDSIVTALGGNAITITGASTGLTLANSQVLVQAGNNVAPISVAGIYSIFNTVYDKPNSTLSGTSTNSIDYFQYINADNITIGNGLTVTGSLNVKGQTTAAGFTGSLFGTSSWARNVTTASYALNAVSASFASTASYVNPLNQQVIITGSLAQGLGVNASGIYSNAQGYLTLASGENSHAEGFLTIASGHNSHAEGSQTTAIGAFSHAEGNNTIAVDEYQHIQGKFNSPVSGSGAMIVGNGTSDVNRSNLIYAQGDTVQITGSLQISGSITGSLFGTASNAVSSSYVISASYAVSSSYAYTASSAVSAYTASSSVSSSYAYTASSAISAYTANSSISSSYAFTASSAISAYTASSSVSSSYAYTASSSVSSSYAYTASSAISAYTASSSVSSSYAITASYAESLKIGLNISASNINVTDNIVANSITAQSASFGYVQTITGSAVIVGQEYIILNTQTPSARYAGLIVYDSGSSTTTTASLVWDSQTNHFVYSNNSGSGYGGGGFIAGPRNSGSLADVTYPTLNRVVRGQGDGHIYDSNIIDDDSRVSISIPLVVTGSVTATTGFTGSLFGTASSAVSSSYAYTASSSVSSSYAYTASSSVSSSYAYTASSAISSFYAYTASSSISSSYAYTASSAISAYTALSSVSSSYAYTASSAISSSYALTASYALNGGGGGGGGQAPIGIAATDEVSLLNIGLKFTFRMPTAFTLAKVKASLVQAPSGSSLITDVRRNGTTIFSTLLSIDAGETTSETAAVPAVLSTTSFADDDEMTIYITQIGSTSAGRGLKLWFI